MMNAIQSQIQAFKLLHGLETLPTSGEEALQAWASFSQYLLSTVSFTPHLEKLANSSYESSQHPSSAQSSAQKYKEHFIDLSTGIRLHYLSWPCTSDDVIILLHGIAQCANTWIELGTKLYERGYTVFALDLRGHGAAAPSQSGNYAATHLAEDVNAFIIAKDLYIRPVALVGCGIGGAVALTLANKAPSLVGAVACLDFGLPSAVAEINRTTEDTSSVELLPWWSFWMGQGLKFQSPAQCAAFLMSPLAQVGPALFPSLLSATAKEDTQGIKRSLDTLNRPVTAVAQDAAIMLRPVPAANSKFSNSNSYKERFLDDDFPEFEVKMDPKFFFKFDIDAMKRGIITLKAHLLVLYGERSSMVPKEDAVTLAKLATPTAASVTTVPISQTGHYVVQDAPNDVYTALVAFLEGPAVTCFTIEGIHLDNPRSTKGNNSIGNCSAEGKKRDDDDNTKKSYRRPEVLGIRPLPEYTSIEEAKKALGPRNIPTAEAIEEELRKLRLEERVAAGAGAGDACFTSDDEEGDNKDGDGDSKAAERKRKTALSQDPSDYFGFVG